MHVPEQVRLVIYRCHEKGLEVLLVNTGLDEESWRIPFEEIAKYKDAPIDENMISLTPIRLDDGRMVMALAVESDWHDIPSIRKLIKGDLDIVTNKVKYITEKGAYFAFKEAFKKVLPNEYQMLHELKDILTARNMLSNI